MEKGLLSTKCASIESLASIYSTPEDVKPFETIMTALETGDTATILDLLHNPTLKNSILQSLLTKSFANEDKRFQFDADILPDAIELIGEK
jgi:hypothetical protein